MIQNIIDESLVLNKQTNNVNEFPEHSHLLSYKFLKYSKENKTYCSQVKIYVWKYCKKNFNIFQKHYSTCDSVDHHFQTSV